MQLERVLEAAVEGGGSPAGRNSPARPARRRQAVLAHEKRRAIAKATRNSARPRPRFRSGCWKRSSRSPAHRLSSASRAKCIARRKSREGQEVVHGVAADFPVIEQVARGLADLPHGIAERVGDRNVVQMFAGQPLLQRPNARRDASTTVSNRSRSSRRKIPPTQRTKIPSCRRVTRKPIRRALECGGLPPLCISASAVSIGGASVRKAAASRRTPKAHVAKMRFIDRRKPFLQPPLVPAEVR